MTAQNRAKETIALALNGLAQRLSKTPGILTSIDADQSGDYLRWIVEANIFGWNDTLELMITLRTAAGKGDLLSGWLGWQAAGERVASWPEAQLENIDVQVARILGEAESQIRSATSEDPGSQ